MNRTRLIPLSFLIIAASSCASNQRGIIQSGENELLPRDLPVSIQPAQEYRYENIPWGSAADVVQAALRRLGLSVIDTTRFGDGIFEHTGASPRMLLRAGMVDGGLQIVSIEWITNDSTAGPLYDKLKEELSGRYGAPHDTLEIDPADGDDDTPQVIWGGPRHGATTELSLDVSSQQTVILAYEGPLWAAESDRRARLASRP